LEIKEIRFCFDEQSLTLGESRGFFFVQEEKWFSPVIILEYPLAKKIRTDAGVIQNLLWQNGCQRIFSIEGVVIISLTTL
jgi:hypothetical protein